MWAHMALYGSIEAIHPHIYPHINPDTPPISPHSDHLEGLHRIIISLMYHFPSSRCHDCSKSIVCMLVVICCEPIAAAQGQVEDGLRLALVEPVNELYAEWIPIGSP